MSAGCKGRAAVRAGVWPARVMGCALVAAGFWIGGVASVAGQCEVGFAPGFGYAGVNGTVNAIAEYDDGTGPAIYVAGEFTIAGEVPVSSIARWDGGQWSDVGGGMTAGVGFQIYVLCVFDDGSGPALYAGGWFDAMGGVPARGIARWDGKRWTDVGGSLVEGTVHAMVVHDFGSGPELVIGGWFEQVGQSECHHVARWNGQTWAPLASGATLDRFVEAMAVFDSGNGPELYAAGLIDSADGAPAGHIIRWDGTAWRDVGGGVEPNWHYVPIYDMTVFDDGTGPALYVSGAFDSAGGVPAENVARWDGQLWSPVGAGIPFHSSMTYDLAVYDLQVGRRDGRPVLYAAGMFRTYARKGEEESLAWWDGQQWSFFRHHSGDSIDRKIHAVHVQCTPYGDRLLVGGEIRQSGTDPLDGLAVIAQDRCMPAIPTRGLHEPLERIAAVEMHTGASLLGVRGHQVLAWNGRFWNVFAEAGSRSDSVTRLRTVELGSTTHLFALGRFGLFAGLEARGVAIWDGSLWRPLGDNAMFSGTVRDVVVHDDGRGPALFFAGSWNVNPETMSPGVVRWDGSGWSRLEEGLPNTVRALAVYDDGSGPLLYAAGSFESLHNGMPARFIAVWNGHWWSGVGGEPAHWSGTGIHDLCVFDDGSGLKLYVTGGFLDSPGAGPGAIVRWDGTAWEAVGDGLAGEGRDLEVYDDGSGPALFVAGSFPGSTSADRHRLARWDGKSWQLLMRGPSDYDNQLAESLAVHDDGGGERLIVSGRFQEAEGAPRLNLASFGPVGPSIEQHPADVLTAPGERAAFATSVRGSPQPSYQWYFNGAPLSDGGNVSGATSARLVIDPVASASDGLYDVLVTNDCGGTISRSARLIVVGGGCLGDLNADGRTSFADITLLLASFGSGPGGDLDGDADTDLDDLLVLLSDFGCGG